MGRHANYRVITDDPEGLIIEDLGPWDKHYTVTNDVENVVRELAPRLAGRRLLYFDSIGELAELSVKDGRFAGFAPAPR